MSTTKHSLSSDSLSKDPKQALLKLLLEKKGIRFNAQTIPRRSVLVKIQTGCPGKIPLFFVHAVGGGVLCYSDLARYLGEKQPFYGLQSPFSENELTNHTKIETMASHYIEEILKVQSDGPYLLGGWSMGGVVAFEMAQQLKAIGQKVPLLAMLDSHVPILNREPEQETDLLVRFAKHLSLLERKDNMYFPRLKQLPSDEQSSYVLDLLKQGMNVSPHLDLSEFQHLFEVFKCNLRAIRCYVPRFYPDCIRLFKCLEQMGKKPSHDLGWSAFTGENLTIHQVPGNHFTMVRSPHIALLAEQLKQYLSELEN